MNYESANKRPPESESETAIFKYNRPDTFTKK